MTYLKISSLCFLFCSSISFASTLASSAPPHGFVQAGAQSVHEDDVNFRYTSNDGTIDLKCAHTFTNPEAWDWDVWCGKGTNMLRTFRVHFLIRQYQSSTTTKSAFEVLYWVTDRDQKMDKAFSSTTQWLQFSNGAQPESFSFSQGVENDYASLNLEFKPGSGFYNSLPLRK